MIPLSRKPLSANRRHVVATYTAAFALLAERVNRHQQRRDREKNAEKFDVRHRASPRFQHLYAKAGCHRVSPLGYCISIPYSGKNGKAFAVFAGVGGVCRRWGMPAVTKKLAIWGEVRQPAQSVQRHIHRIDLLHPAFPAVPGRTSESAAR